MQWELGKHKVYNVHRYRQKQSSLFFVCASSAKLCIFRFFTIREKKLIYLTADIATYAKVRQSLLNSPSCEPWLVLCF